MMKLIAFFIILLSCNRIGFLSFDGGKGGSKEKKKKPDPIKTDSFVPEITSRNILDLILVVDNSHSMGAMQKELSGKMHILLKVIKNSDWKIAITTTDPRDCPKTIITKHIPNYENLFVSAITGLGTNGTTLEQATRMAIKGLKSDCHGKRWWRDNSTLALLFVTDEDNVADGFCGEIKADGFANNDLVLAKEKCSVATLHAYLQEIRTPRVDVKIYGLINTLDNKNFLTWKDDKGKHIFDHHASVHDKDYTATLTQIAQNIHSTLQNKFVLSEIYWADSSIPPRVVIKHVRGQDVLDSRQYKIINSTLIIKDMPVGTTGVEITYHHK